jgi:hypothetical protein
MWRRNKISRHFLSDCPDPHARTIRRVRNRARRHGPAGRGSSGFYRQPIFQNALGLQYGHRCGGHYQGSIATGSWDVTVTKPGYEPVFNAVKVAADTVFDITFPLTVYVAGKVTELGVRSARRRHRRNRVRAEQGPQPRDRNASHRSVFHRPPRARRIHAACEQARIRDVRMDRGRERDHESGFHHEMVLRHVPHVCSACVVRSVQVGRRNRDRLGWRNARTDLERNARFAMDRSRPSLAHRNQGS